MDQTSLLSDVEWSSYTPRPQHEVALRVMNMSLLEHLERVLAFAPADHDVHWRLNKLKDEFGDYLTHREVGLRDSRLARINQHAHQVNYDAVGERFPITRLHHSRHVAAFATLFALCAKLDTKRVVAACEGAWRHDLGHPPFCHPTEYVITTAPFNVDSHEQRGLFMSMDDPELDRLVSDRGIVRSDVMKAMLEEGEFPTQSLADTAAYVELDGHFIGEPPTEDFAWRLAASINGAEAGRLFVDDAAPIQEMLDLRARYHQMFYSSWRGRVADAALGELIRFILANHLLDKHDLVFGVDAQLSQTLMSILRGEVESSDWYRSLARIARGDMRELSDHWNEQLFHSMEDYQHAVCSLKWRKDLLLVPTRNFANKRVRIVSRSGAEREIQAKVQLRPEDRAWYIYTYKRP